MPFDIFRNAVSQKGFFVTEWRNLYKSFVSFKVANLALNYVNNYSLLNDMKPGSIGGKDNLQRYEAYVWGSNSSHQLGEQLQDKVMQCKRSKAFERAYQVNRM